MNGRRISLLQPALVASALGRGLRQLRQPAVRALVVLALLATVLVQWRTAQASISLVGTATSGTGNGATSITLNRPSGATTGDLVLAVIASRGNGTVTNVPSGFQVAEGQFVNAGDLVTAVYWKVLVAGDPSSFTFQFSNTALKAATMLAFRGIDPVQPIAVQEDTLNGASTTIGNNGVVTPVANTLLVGVYAQATGGASITPPFAMTTRAVSGLSGANGVSLRVATQTQAAAGATGARDASSSVSAASTGMLLALQPASTFSISGTVFEDRNYGGGAGRSLAASSGSGVNAASVELYNSSGQFVTSTTTAPDGSYSFAGLAAGTYHVRVASQTVQSGRTGSTSALRGVMTFRTNASTGTAVAVTDHVGGTNPDLADPASGSSGTTFNTSTYAFSAGLSGTAHAVAPVTIGSANISGVDFGFHFGTVVNDNASGQGSLAQAIVNANTLGGDNALAQAGRTAAIEHVVFMIPNGSAAPGLRSSFNLFSGGVASIAPAATLAVSSSLVIDAQTQPGWVDRPIIELNGTGAPAGSHGFDIGAGPTTVRGFIVNRWPAIGINAYAGSGHVFQGIWSGLNSAGTAASANGTEGLNLFDTPNATVGGTTAAQRNVLSGNGNNGLVISANSAGTVVRGNYIGTNTAGTARVQNGSLGIYLNVQNATIGGTDVGAGNVISGNTWQNLLIDSNSGGTLVVGNLIGLDAAGSASLTNGAAGIDLRSSNVTIGGTTASARNVISGNGGSGIEVAAGTTGTQILGNRIGTNAAGTGAVGNGQEGITLLAPATVGGVATGHGNTVAYNTGNGISVRGTATGAAIRGNAVFANGSLGIDLGNDGVTANDGAKTAGQPNERMDMPVIAQAVLGPTTLTVTGFVGSAAEQTTFGAALVDVYVSDVDASGHGEGATWVGTLTADANGWFTGTLPTTGITGLVAGTTRVTATATDAGGNTSEFAANAVTAALAPLANGGFEVATIQPASGFRSYLGGATDITGWVVRRNGVDHIGTALWQPAEGSNSVELNRNNIGGMQQTVLTVPGQTYTLAFSTAGHPTCGFPVKSITVSAAGASATYSFSVAGRSFTDMGWREDTLSFTATSEATTLVFDGQAGHNCGPAVDNVRLLGSGSHAISGSVFEDRNYGGGAGRSLTDSGGTAVSGARVELYNSGGQFINSTSTSAAGTYTFASLAAGTYHVRVASQTVQSGRTGSTSALRGVLTFRTNASTGTAVAVTDHVGGTNPDLADPASGGSGTTFNTSTYVFSAGLSGTAHAVAPVTIGSASISGVDFGFHFGTVVNDNASGQGSLAQAIVNANTLGGDNALAQAGRTAAIEHVVFMIPNGSAAPGLRSSINLFSSSTATITPATALPTITSTLVIDARAQPGWTAAPVIVLDGVNAGSSSDGLAVTSGALTVRGLSIVRFGSNGLDLGGTGVHTVQGCYVGLRPDGTTAAANGAEGIRISASTDGTLIGGTQPSDRNVISGNGTSGIGVVDGGRAVQIIGNYIGTTADGTAARGNGFDGVRFDDNDGAGSLVQANVIAGSAQDGITIRPGATNVSVVGNSIGTNALGAAALPNQRYGVEVVGNGAIIGGTSVALRNVIAGNASAGVSLEAANATVAGNLIGLGADGLTTLPNTNGIQILGSNNVVGGSTSSHRNVIAGNSAWGVDISGSSNVVAGNWIGHDAAGNVARPNLSGGVSLAGSNNVVGGSSAQDGNVIGSRLGGPYFGVRDNGSASTIRHNRIGTNTQGTAAQAPNSYGVGLFGTNAVLRDNLISGNYLGVWIGAGSGHTLYGNLIGTQANGTSALGNNGEGGLVIIDGVTNVTVGGPGAGEPNTIAHNIAGVRIRAANSNIWPQRIRLSANSIHSNTQLGIDLWTGDAGGWTTGVTANDGALTSGQPNQLMDHPVITSARTSGNQLTINGHVGSAAGQAVFAGARVEVFVSDNDASGFGEGQTYLGFLTTDASGNFSGSLTVPSGVTITPGTTRLTATATDTSNNTSEFGPNVRVESPSISGTVFEDVNYGGGLGRNRATAVVGGGSGRAGARVELYTVSGTTATFASFTTTDAAGSYSFGELAVGTYAVRVVGSSVSSARSGYTTSLRPVLTFRTDASSGSATDVYDFVGGINPAATAAVNAGSGATFDTTTGAFTAGISGTAEAFTLANTASGSLSGVDFGFNFNTVTHTNDSGQGSLRQVITNANTLSGDAGLATDGRSAGTEHVVFMISNGTASAGLRAGLNYFSGGVATISSAAALPALSSGLVLDAQTQPGWSTRPIIELAGGSGLEGQGANIIRGFVINRSSRDGITLSGSGSLLQGNWIGLDRTGTAASPNVQDGVALAGPGHTIGGNSATRRNVVSGNGRMGIDDYPSAGGHVVVGNYIGVDPSGSIALGNAAIGIALDNSPNNRLGGTLPGEGNVISGNAGIGAYIASTGALLVGNRVGTDASGSAAVPNASVGVFVEGVTTIGATDGASANLISGNNGPGILVGTAGRATVLGNQIGPNASGASTLPNAGGGIVIEGSSSQIGGTAAGAGNVITGNGGTGVLVQGSATQVAILGNRIWANADLGIDLGPSGVTVNDANDSDSGANNLQNFPVLTSAVVIDTNQIEIAGTLASTANSFYRIELFASASADSSGHGEGTRYLGAAEVQTNASGSASFSTTLTATVAAGEVITATATRSVSGFGSFTDTSEFSAAITVSQRISGTVFEDRNYGGGAGRSLADGGGSGVSGARVELYNSSGQFVTSTTTAADGRYSFTGIAAGSYHVRVASQTVLSGRSGSTSALRGVLTFRTNASSGSAVAVTDLVGGTNPALADPGSGGTGTTFNTSTYVFSAGLTGTAHAVAPVTIGSGSAGGVDFGFNFNTVVNTNDSGQGSLRQAIINANTLTGETSLAQQYRTASMEHIVFMLPNGTIGGGGSLSLPAGGMRSGFNVFTTPGFAGNVATVTVQSNLPLLTTGLVLDAQTQPGWTLHPLVEIDGSATTTHVLRGDGANIVRGLIINRGGLNGLFLGGTGSVAEGNWLGLNALGTAAAPNAQDGIALAGTGHRVGGSTAAQRNIISGNTRFGIDDVASTTGNHVVVGNWIGLNATGTAAVGNGSFGISFDNTPGNRIGGSAAGEGNVIAGNGGFGIRAGPNGLTVMGNRIGTDASGTAALANGDHGIALVLASSGDTGITIGGSAVGAGNQISGNQRAGIYIDGNNASRGAGTVIAGNLIGLRADGQATLANGSHGIEISNGATGVLIGGTATGAGNVVSGNSGSGVRIGGGASAITLRGNLIGVNAAGNAAVANSGDGVVVGGSASSVLIGGGSVGDGNVISGNGGNGIELASSSSGVTVQGNRIGTNSAGTAAIANADDGIQIAGSSHTIGGEAAGAGNLISGNADDGIDLLTSTSNVVIRGNRIGTNTAGTGALANGGDGIDIDGGTSHQIGGTAAGAGNTIAHNASRGVRIDSGSGISILGNAIHSNGHLGIDNVGGPQTASGVNLNDGAVTAGGVNLLMDHPVITSARARGSQLTVAGYVGSAAGQAAFAGARVEIFASDNDGSGFGEGRTYLGALTADASGNFSGTLTMPVVALARGTRLTGTATDSSGNTSEFGANFSAVIFDLVVNHNGDAVDANPGDGLCETSVPQQCTLRAAIAEVNAWGAQTPAPTIAFALPGCSAAGQTACIIVPTSALPAVSQRTIIDGQTQPGWTQMPLVELDGRSAPSASNGLLINAIGSTVRGLAVGGFGQSGVRIAANDATIEGNHIGLAADGTTVRANGPAGSATGGIYLASGTGVVVGGATATQRNVLSGNGGSGVWVQSGTATIIGNYIGTDATGSAARGNGRWGVHVEAGNAVRIGSATAGHGNVIAANAGAQEGGVHLKGTGHVVQGNVIGMNATRTAALPNADGGSAFSSGIDVRQGSHLIGGTEPGEGNVIAFNQGHGVRVSASSARILGNRIEGNLWLGIDLGADGLSANDGALSSVQPSGGMDHPVLTLAAVAGSGTSMTVSGHIGTGTGQAAFAGSRVEIFKAAADASGYGEGAVFVGALTADANGRFSGTLTFAAGVVAIGDTLTATATDPAGRTSEFGPNFASTSTAALAPSRFNAFETSTASNALAGPIKTMTSGQARTLALIAVDNAGTGLATNFSGTVAIDWLDASAGGSVDATGCSPAWTVVGSAGNATFSAGTPRVNVTLTPAGAGRNWRLRFSHTTGGSTITACSSDNFAVKPATLAVTAVGSADSSTAGIGASARSLTNGNASGGVVHRAGRPFALRARGQLGDGTLATGYDGIASATITACTLPASGCVAGTLRNAGNAATLVASNGVLASDLMSYSEVGAISVRLSDPSFADVDAADSSAEERLLQSAEFTLGRFVPDSYTLATASAGQLAPGHSACAAPGAAFTFFGQGFSWASAPQMTVTARNADGQTTVNWTGALMKLTDTHVSATLGLTPALAMNTTAAPLAITDLGGGSARVVAGADSFALVRGASPVASARPSFSWTLSVSDSSESSVAGNGTISVTPVASTVAFASGSGDFHYGRIALASVYGDARRAQPLPVEVQAWNGLAWAPLAAAGSCITLPAGAFAYNQARGALDAGSGVSNCGAAVRSNAGTIAGRASPALDRLPPSALPSAALTVRLNLGAASGQSCSGATSVAATSAALPWLAAPDGSDPSARITWGAPRSDFVMVRERFD